jgi:hypothetical protein
MFKILMYAKKLECAGVSREQAEAHVQLIAEIIEGDMATKEDLKRVEAKLMSEMTHLENRLTIKLGTIVTIALGAFAAAVKFF